MRTLLDKLKGPTSGKKNKKWIMGGLGATVILALILISGMKGLAVETDAVQKEDVRATVWEKGKMISRDTIDIYSEVQGKVLEVYVEPGDTVEKGALLAILDVSDLEAQIARMEGELKAVQGMEKSAQSQGDSNHIRQQEMVVGQAKVTLGLARDSFNRIQELFEAGAVTRQELDQAKAEMETREKALTQAEAALAVVKNQNAGSKLQYDGQKESLRAQLDHLKSQKEKARITADRDGLVFSKQIKEGDYVNPGMLLFNVGKKGQLEVETYVNNKDIANVNIGDEVQVIFKVPGKDLEAAGVIKRIAPAAEQRLSALGVAEDKIKVNVEIKTMPDKMNITLGMTVDVVVTTQAVNNVVAVPKEALFSDAGADYVWIVQDGKAMTAKVETGVEGDDRVEIKKGLKEGQVVLMNPHLPELREGVKISR